MSCKLHSYSSQKTQSPQGPRLPKKIGNTHLRNHYNLKGKEIDVNCTSRWSLALFVCDVGRWLFGRVSGLNSEIAGSISSEGDHGIHYWWDMIRSKQLSTCSGCHAQVFAGFYGHDNSIYNIIPLLKKTSLLRSAFAKLAQGHFKVLNHFSVSSLF